MMPQFELSKNKVINYRNIALGLFLFSIGLFKKVIIADRFALWATPGFDTAPSLNLFAAWAASLSYTFQVYFDFSGYTDMAIGVSKMFNIDLPVNFNSPYKAKSIIDFWKRWHITLTNFITTYVYTPILRSFGRITFGASLVAVFLSMLISGFWHGAGWTFVIWGALHGAALVINHLWRRRKLPMYSAFGWLMTFMFINASFVFFRAKTLADAGKMFKGMLGQSGVVLPSLLANIFGPLKIFGVEFMPKIRLILAEIGGRDETIIKLILAFFLVLVARNSTEMSSSFRPTPRNVVFVTTLSLIALINMSSVSEFLYFNF